MSSPSTAKSILASNPEIIDLLKWCHSQSDAFTKDLISPAEFPIPSTELTYRGICALKRIPIGTQVLSMPEECLITSHSFPSELVNASYLSLQEKFTLFLIMEGKNSSPFSAYLNTLPSDFSSHHPGYLKKDEVAMLPKWCSSIIAEQQSLVESGYEKALKFLDNKGEIDSSFETYRWAWYCVYTRTVFFNKKGDGESSKEMALAPYLDLFNHSPEPNTNVSYEEGKGYTITSTKEILSREQIYINYGPHPNHTLWSDYGFIPSQPNPFRCIPIKITSHEGSITTSSIALNNWIQKNIMSDKTKIAFIEDSGLLAELYLLDNELSCNLELVLSVGLWNPTNGAFDYEVKRSTSFIQIAEEIITNERNKVKNSLDFFVKLGSNGVYDNTIGFLKDCIALCDKLHNLYVSGE